MKALVLAAGKGVRMRPLTDNKPKAMVQLKGKPLLQYTLASLEKAGIEECGIIIGYKGESIKAYFGDSFREMKLKYFSQEKPLGTANAIAVAEEWLNEDFIVASADVIADFALYRKLLEKKGYSAVFALRHDDFPERYGVIGTAGEKVVNITEKPRKAEKDALVNSGIYRFSSKVFGAIRSTKKSMRNEFEITDSIRILLSGGDRVGFVLLDGPCLDIGSIQDLERAEQAVQSEP